MYKQIFANFNDGHLVIIGFMLFMITFVGALVWTLFVREKSFYENLAQKPLIGGE